VAIRIQLIFYGSLILLTLVRLTFLQVSLLNKELKPPILRPVAK
jgi:hypothetical protein